MRIKSQAVQFCLTFLFVCLSCEPLFCNTYNTNISQEYLLPEDHPFQDKLKSLFTDKKMFSSTKNFKKAGFETMKRDSRNSLMVAKHPSIGNYLFKKHKDYISHHEQLVNYLTRISGARALSDFIGSKNLQHILTPKKWLYLLPKEFSDPITNEKSYILIVEDMDIYSGGKDPKGDVARKYYNIDLNILKELCVVLIHFRGLDSRLHNVPLTRSGKIAFIDTECWEEEEREGFMTYILPFLSKVRKKYVKSVYQELKISPVPYSYSPFDQNFALCTIRLI